MLKPFNIFLFYFLPPLMPWVHSPNLSSLAVSFTPTSDLLTDLASNLVADLSFDIIVTSFRSLLWSHCCIPSISLSEAALDKFFLIYIYGIPYNFFFFFFCCSGLILVVDGWFCVVIGGHGLWWVSCCCWDILYLFIYFYIYCRRVF